MNALRIFLSLVDWPLPGVHQTAAPDVNRSVGRILSRPQDHSRGVQPARASPTLPPGMIVIPAKAAAHVQREAVYRITYQPTNPRIGRRAGALDQATPTAKSYFAALVMRHARARRGLHR